MTRPSDHALSFEAVKTSLRQDKSGYSLVLAVHPDEVPEELMRDWVGTRYQVVLVAIGDDEQPKQRATPAAQRLLGSPEFPQPVDSPQPKPHSSHVALAGQLCREPGFMNWAGVEDEAGAADYLKARCRIDSRAELAWNQEAQRLLGSIVEEYRTDSGFPQAGLP